MRRKAQESDLIIVNHHLFFADLNIKQKAPEATRRRHPARGRRRRLRRGARARRHCLQLLRHRAFAAHASTSSTRDVEATLRAKKASTSTIESLAPRSKIARACSSPRCPMRAPAQGRIEFSQREAFLESDGDIYLGTLSALERLERRARPGQDRTKPRALRARRGHPPAPQVPARIRRAQHRLLD